MELWDVEYIGVTTIATESRYHAEIALYCMNKDKHIIVEKPMVMSIDYANEMIESEVEIDSVYGKGHTPLFRDVIDAINEDRKPYVSGEDAIVPLSIILAAYK